MYTLGEAAKVTGMTKAALSKAISKGRISAEKDDTGRFRIDPSELHRIYPPVNTAPLKSEQEQTQETVAENKELKARVDLLGELLKQVQGERDNLREQNTRLTALLPSPRSKPEEPEKPKGFFKRLFGG